MIHDLYVNTLRTYHFIGDKNWNHIHLAYHHNTIYIVRAGDGHIRLKGKVTDLKPGWAYLIPLKHFHDVWCDSHIDKTYTDLHVEMLPGCDVFDNIDEVLSVYLGMEKCEQIIRLSENYEKNIADRLAFKGELNLILAKLMPKEAPLISVDMMPLMPIVFDMQNNLSAQFRRQEIAERHGWNPSTLSRKFKQAFGCGVKQYAEKLLIKQLAEDLISTDKTLQELAFQYGFCDAYYFSAFFKRNMGVSPTVYRKTHRFE